MASALQTIGWTILIGLLVVTGCVALVPETNPPPHDAPCLERPWHSSSAAGSADDEGSRCVTSSNSTLLQSWHARCERYYQRTFIAIEVCVYRLGWSVVDGIDNFLNPTRV